MPELAGVRIEGISIGGIETCLHLPGLKLAFDVGRCPAEVVRSPTILFTHAHVDHMGGVVNHAATRALRHMSPPTYVVPHEDAEAFRDLFDTWRRLDRSELSHHLVALGPGEEHALGDDLVARPFRSPHRSPCQGYGLWRRRRKLKPAYRGLPEDEIRRLRVEQDLEVTETRETPEVAFTGDARIEVVDREAVVRTARVLIMEVTFVDERVSVEQARAKGHIHLDEVAQRAELFENEALLLTHFSSRYEPDEILQALDRKLPRSLRERVTPLLVGL